MQRSIVLKPYELLDYFNKNEKSYPDKSDFLITLGALCGIACQLAAKEAKREYSLVKAGDKNYFFGNGLNYYLLESNNSFINIIKNKFTDSAFPNVVDILKKVAGNIGNKNYKINELINPEEKYSYYLEIWEQISDIVKNNTNVPEGWPIILTKTLEHYILVYTLIYGEDQMISLLPTIIENAFYVSKIIQ